MDELLDVWMGDGWTEGWINCWMDYSIDGYGWMDVLLSPINILNVSFDPTCEGSSLKPHEWNRFIKTSHNK